jgi:hypothetical protein
VGAWSTAAIDGGDLAATNASALAGAFGIEANVDDLNPLYVQDDSPGDEPHYRARFLLDPNGFDTGEANLHRRNRVFIAFAEGPQRRVAVVVLRRQSGLYALLGRARLDDNTQADTPFVPISDAPHAIEIELVKSSAPGANDGAFEMWVDGVSSGRLTALDNDRGEVDFARMGALSLKSAASGTLRFDAFESRRQSYIGPVP